MRSSRLRRLLPVLVVLGGVVLLSYPLVSTVWNNYQERLVSRAYVGHVNTQADTDKRAYMQAAFDYNEAKTANVFIDPYRDQEAHGSAVASGDYDEYKSVLADGVGPMAVVSIPKISVSLPVYHGTSHSTLQRGAGHLFGSDLPVGGSNRHAIITAHTGLANSTMFDQLTDLNIGDSIYIDIQDQTLEYRVTTTEVIEPSDISKLQRQAGQDLLTLITCHPYGVNSHRLIVTAQRHLPDPDASPAVALPRPAWMILFAIAIAISVLIAIAIIVATIKNRRNTSNDATGNAGKSDSSREVHNPHHDDAVSNNHDRTRTTTSADTTSASVNGESGSPAFLHALARRLRTRQQ